MWYEYRQGPRPTVCSKVVVDWYPEYLWHLAEVGCLRTEPPSTPSPGLATPLVRRRGSGRPYGGPVGTEADGPAYN